MSPFLAVEEKQYLKNFHNIFHDPSEADQYLFDCWERMQVVLQWLDQLQKKGMKTVLELGSNPYFLTLLIKKHFDLDLHLANFFGDASENGVRTHVVEGAGERHEFSFSHFNLEVDRFPYEDGFFDCVIFCEILEHLLLNPDFAISEMLRILKPNGFLIVTTPNAARLANLVTLLKGRNIYQGYSPHGAYGRHNREYTLAEVRQLLERNSFQLIETDVRNIYPHPLRSRVIQSLRPNVWYEHIFVLARK